MNPHSIPIGVGGFADRTELTGIQCMYAVVLSGSIKRKNPKTKTCVIYILVDKKNKISLLEHLCNGIGV